MMSSLPSRHRPIDGLFPSVITDQRRYRYHSSKAGLSIDSSGQVPSWGHLMIQTLKIFYVHFYIIHWKLLKDHTKLVYEN